MKKILYFLIFAILFLLSIPIYEAYSSKEYPSFNSIGNCRIKNIELAIEKNASIYFFYNHKNGQSHVLAVKNNKYYDISNNKYEEGDFNGTYKGFKPIYFTNIKHINFNGTNYISILFYLYTKVFILTKNILNVQQNFGANKKP